LSKHQLQTIKVATASFCFHPTIKVTQSSTPVVCLVIEGGMNTIRAVLEYVTDTPPVPVVVVDGSGRAADIIAFVHKYASEHDEQNLLDAMKDYLINMIMKTFEVGTDQAERLYSELLQCTKYKNLITVFRIQDRPEGPGAGSDNHHGTLQVPALESTRAAESGADLESRGHCTHRDLRLRPGMATRSSRRRNDASP